MCVCVCDAWLTTVYVTDDILCVLVYLLTAQSLRAPVVCGLVLLEHRHPARALQPRVRRAVRLCVLVLLQREVSGG